MYIILNRDPNESEDVSLPTWPPFESSSNAYLILGKTLVAADHYRRREMDLWLTDIPALLDESDTGISKVTNDAQKTQTPQITLIMVSIFLISVLEKSGLLTLLT